MRPEAFDNFRDANEALRGLGITYWIDCGTLLGHVREEGFLDHDEDIDFGVFTDRHEDIATWMAALGFEVYGFYGTLDNGYEQSFKRHDVKVDIFYFYSTPPFCGWKWGELWQGSWWKGKHLIVSEFHQSFLDPQPAQFLGEWTYLPREPEAVLEQRYEDWRTPREKWRWYRDPKCIREDTLPPELQRV